MSTDQSGASTAPRIFSSSDALRILAQRPGKPTGTIVHVLGFDVDLRPFATETGGMLFDLLDRTTGFAEALQAESVPLPMLTKLVAVEGRTITAMLKELLRDSLEVGDEPAENDAFEKWFARVPLLPTLKDVLPKVLEANGISQMIRPLAAAPEPAVAETVPVDNLSVSGTSSGTS